MTPTTKTPAARPADLFDAILEEAGDIRALADMLEAIFTADQSSSDPAMTPVNMLSAGPGFAVVARSIAERTSALTDHAQQLFDGINEPAAAAGGGR